MAANFLQITATTQVKVGFGKLKGIFTSSGTPTVAIYDSGTASTSDPKIIATTTTTVPSSITFTGDEAGVGFTKGLYVVIGGGSPQVTVFYE